MQISIIGIEARNKAVKGMDYLVDAVRQTLGPFGKNVLIEKGGRITNDGYTVSKEICPSIKDEFERRGALTVHEASSKTNDQVGDATTTSEVLVQGIVKEAIKYLPMEGSIASKKKPSEIIQQIKDEKDFILKELEKQVKSIETKEELINSAKVSVEDDELAKLIGETQWEIGPDGVILAEETSEYKSSIERVKGIKFDNGFGTSLVINRPEKGSLEADKCRVIMTNYVLEDLRPIQTLLQNLANNGEKEIIVIARAWSPEAIRLCKINHDAGIHIYPMNAPYTNQKEVMLDLEAVLGGKYIDTEEGKLEDIGLLEVGYATKLQAKRFEAIIAGNDDKLTQERVNERVAKLKKDLKGSTSEFEKKMIESRISQLQNGFAILKVGAETDVERKRKKDKADDAVQAVRLALKGGTVKGAGLAFKEIAEGMEDTSLLKRPLMLVNQLIMASAPEGFVVEHWVRDPYLVLKSALENACSVAGTLASVNGIVVSENPHQCQCAKSLEEN